MRLPTAASSNGIVLKHGARSYAQAAPVMEEMASLVRREALAGCAYLGSPLPRGLGDRSLTIDSIASTSTLQIINFTIIYQLL